MKKKIFLTLVALFVLKINNTQSQKTKTLKITYIKDYYQKIDTSKSKSYKKNISTLNYLISKNSENLSYELIIYNHHSSFKLNKLKMNRSDNNFIKSAASLGGTGGLFYINKKDSTFINKKKIAGDEFLIKLKPKKWKITNEMKTINNFMCYKATTLDIVNNHKGIFKFNVTAWFCPSLPNFYGPAKYFGLPGLILELDNGKTVLKASKITFTNDKVDLKTPNKGIKLTEEEFQEFIKNKSKKMFKNAFKKN